MHPQLREALIAGEHCLLGFALEHEDEQPTSCSRTADELEPRDPIQATYRNTQEL